MVKKIISAGAGLLLLAAPLSASAQSASLPILPANPTIAQLQSEVQELIQFLDQLLATRSAAAALPSSSASGAPTGHPVAIAGGNEGVDSDPSGNGTASTPAPDTVVPITQEALSSGDIRYSIPVDIGGDSVQALLDTGSVGLRMLPNTVPASDYTPSTVSNSVAYGAGDVLTGIVAQASLSIGGLSASVPVEAVQSVTCKTGSPNCLTTAPFLLSGWPAIIGVGLKGQSIPNPLTQIGSGEWIIDLPLPGSSAPGELILNPTAADLAGYTLFQLPAQSAAEVNADITPRWDDTQMPLCVTRSDTGASFCHGALLDTGAQDIQPESLSPNPWSAGISATMTLTNGAGAKMDGTFTVGSGYGSQVYLDQNAVTTPGVTWNAGAIPFFSFSVLYDSKDGIIGLKARDASTAPADPPAISATTSLAATSSSTTPVVPLTTSTAAVAAFSWSQSLPVTFAGSGIGPFRGTETRALVFSGGSLYAGIGDWEDPDFDDAKEPGAQILRLDSPDGQWVVDQDFNQTLASGKKEYLAIGALAAFQFTETDTGQAIAPVDTMFASVWSNGAGLDIFQKIGDSGAWTRVRLVDAATATAGLGSQVRAFIQYTDPITGRQLVFAGTNPFGIFAGAYDSGSGTILWNGDGLGSTDVPLVNSEGKKGADSDRVMSFAICGGNLYASVYDGIILRINGSIPSWKLIYEQPGGTLPDSSSGFRGLTCVPNTHGSGSMLIAALENNPLEIYDIQITPPYTGVIEENLSSYASSQLGVTVNYGIGAYNNMVAYPTSNPSCPDELIGLHFAAAGYPGAYQGLYPSALYVARHCDGTYGPVETIADPSISPAPPLEATRTMIVSQFSGDPAGTLYAGGYDAHSTTAYNTDWIYRGASSGACAVGSVLQGGFCIIPPPVILAPTLNVSTTTAFMPATVTFSGTAPGPTYTLKYGDKTKVSTQACTGSATACAAVTISQTHTYAAAGTYVATVTTAAGSASTTITVVTPPPTATLTQSLATTNFNGNKAQAFTISWSSTNASSCTLQKANANGTVTDPWATGTSGSQTAVPTVVGTLHWWIDCTGPGGTAHEDLYHAVIQGKLTTTAAASDQLSNMASVLVAMEAILSSLTGSGH